VVTNCFVLTEGVDLPSIGAIVLARPTKQLGLFRQMAGRGLRPAPGKENLLLIDHSGAVYRHGLLEDPIAWTLDVTDRARNATHEARTYQQTSRLVECSQCGALRTGGHPCPACGFMPKPRPDAIIFRDGELHRIDGRDRADPQERARWHAMLTAIALLRGYRAGWVAHKFREKFGTWPVLRSVEPLAPTPEVLSWVRSRNIAWAKAQEKARAA
jgi:superfamily II DNA or RNA helicase